MKITLSYVPVDFTSKTGTFEKAVINAMGEKRGARMRVSQETD